MATIDFGLASNILGISVEPQLITWLAGNVPHGRRAMFAAAEAERHGIPPSLVFAVYAIEITFRPWWIQLLEIVYLAIAIPVWFLTGCGFRNVTVGPFQIGCHRAADHLGVGYTRVNRYWRPARSLHLAGLLAKLPFYSLNLAIACKALRVLWRQALNATADHGFAVIEVGRRYNGYERYGWVLLQLVAFLECVEMTPAPAQRAEA